MLFGQQGGLLDSAATAAHCVQAFLDKNLGAHVEAGCHSMVADFDLISSQDAKILHA